MNIKLILVIIVVVFILCAAWYWYAGMMPSSTQQYGYKSTSGSAKVISADTTTDISSDLNAIPDDSVVNDSVKLIDNSVSKF